MRKSKLTAADIEAAEMADSDRRNSRKNGFSMMEERDRGYTRLRDGTIFLWHVPRDKRVEGMAYANITDGCFGLEIDGKRHVYNVDEFNKAIRWA